MRSIGYHFFEDSNIGLYKSNRSSGEKPIEVNCLGNFITDSAFSTFVPEGREDYYFLYIISGELEMTLPDGIKLCHAGDLTVIPPNTPYRYRHTVNESINYFWIHFTGRDVDSVLDEFGISTYPAIHRLNDNGALGSLFKKMLDASAQQSRFKMSEITVLLYSVLLSCAKALLSDDNTKLQKSVSYINQFYYTDIKIPDLAKMENLSVSRYNTLFKQYMGVSPINYITRSRLSFACELLKGTDLSVKEIAISVGYEDPHFFSRVFKSNIGLSPKEFRKIN